ncbi:hypothetical protein GJAV_G00018020 [Gymnothorax javanicus]|nr:hypothetical protein GJAV_G00018020 [Gymnothorax javanicus]
MATVCPSKFSREEEDVRTDLQLLTSQMNDEAVPRCDLYREAVAVHARTLEVLVRKERLLRASLQKSTLLLREVEDLRRRVQNLEQEKEVPAVTAACTKDDYCDASTQMEEDEP